MQPVPRSLILEPRAGALGRRLRILLTALSFSVMASTAAAQVTLSAVGDVMLGTNYPQDELPPQSGRFLLRAAEPFFKSTDIRFGNLEGPLYDGELPADAKRSGDNRHLFRTPTIFANVLQEAGLNVMSLANNHARDFGQAGLLSTQNALRSRGIQFSDKDSSRATFRIRDSRVVLIAADFYPGRRSLTQSRDLLREIDGLKKEFDVVIVSVHAGAEGGAAMHVSPGPEMYLGENRGDSIRFAHEAIDAGADLILMHGPHVPRGIEVYRDRLVAYSLGNFVTGKGISIAGAAGIAPLLRVQLARDGRFEKGQLISFQQVRNQGVVRDPSQRALQLIRELSTQDFPDTAPDFDESGFFSSRGRLP